MGRQITVGQLIEKQIIMTISKAMIMYIGITSKTSRPTPACIYYYYSTHRPLSSMHLVYDVDKIYSCRNRPHLVILNSNDTYVSCPLLSLVLSIVRSNPSQSTFSHGKKNRSSWPN